MSSYNRWDRAAYIERADGERKPSSAARRSWRGRADIGSPRSASATA